MTATTEACALIAEARKHDEAMTRAPWTPLRSPNGNGTLVNDVRHRTVADCDQPYDDESPGNPSLIANAEGVAWLRTNLRALLDGYATALEENERLARWKVELQAEVETEAHNRSREIAAADVLRADVQRLAETARAASENWMAACRQRDEARTDNERYRVRDVIASLSGLLLELRETTVWDDPDGDVLDRLLGLGGDPPDTAWCLERLRSMVDLTDPDCPIGVALTKAGLT